MDVHPTKNVSIGIDPYPFPNWSNPHFAGFFQGKTNEKKQVLFEVMAWCHSRFLSAWPRTTLWMLTFVGMKVGLEMTS